MATLGLRLAAKGSRAARLSQAWAHGRQMQARGVHHPKTLDYPIEGGLGNFLPPEALKMIAVDYQHGLLERLNEQVRGTDLEPKSVVQTVIEAARDPRYILAFNYASEALNNSFFLQTLKPPPSGALSHENDLFNTMLRSQILTQYKSLEQLKSTFSAGILGMFSSGWMWFVCDQEGDLAFAPAGDEWMRVVGETLARNPSAATPPPSEDTGSPAPSSPASGISHPPPTLHPPTQSRSYSVLAGFSTPSMMDSNTLQPNESEDSTRRDQVLYPLFCVSVHEHAWVGAGYGVWGKEEYMNRFWSVLDWKAVSANYQKWFENSRQARRS